jgi:hypothetical protein
MTAVRCSFMDEPPRAKATTASGRSGSKRTESAGTRCVANDARHDAASTGRFLKEGAPSPRVRGRSKVGPYPQVPANSFRFTHESPDFKNTIYAHMRF